MTYLGDRLVGLPLQLFQLIRAGIARYIGRRLEGEIPDLPIKTGHSLYSLARPRTSGFPWPDEHQEGSEAVPSVDPHLFFRVDHISLGLAHLVAVFAQDEPLVEEPLERLAVIHKTHVV